MEVKDTISLRHLETGKGVEVEGNVLNKSAVKDDNAEICFHLWNRPTIEGFDRQLEVRIKPIVCKLGVKYVPSLTI